MHDIALNFVCVLVSQYVYDVHATLEAKALSDKVAVQVQQMVSHEGSSTENVFPVKLSL